jgi:putative endopeptidase
MAEESLLTLVIWLLTATFPAHAGISALASAAEAVKSNAPPGSNECNFADLYDTFMDEAAIAARTMGLSQPRLAEIAAIQNTLDLALPFSKTLRNDVNMLSNVMLPTPNLFGLWVAPGFSDSEQYMPYLLQGALEMPRRDYCLEQGELFRIPYLVFDRCQ